MNEQQPTVPYGFCRCGCGERTNVQGGEPKFFRHGHWARTRPRLSAEDSFWAKVAKRGPDDCWEWQAFRNFQGYGYFWDPDARKTVTAHRWAFESTGGLLAPKSVGTMGAVGDVVCHRCDNPACCNPAHLFVGTQKDNTADMLAKGRNPNFKRERNPKAKLTEADVAEIRANYSGRYGEKMEIARRYGISSGHVSKIISGDCW